MRSGQLDEGRERVGYSLDEEYDDEDLDRKVHVQCVYVNVCEYVKVHVQCVYVNVCEYVKVHVQCVYVNVCEYVTCVPLGLTER